ncbi:MAG: hypothetical protein KJ767_00435 [Nanoarchaeota archaeon]|nr:hypothetical protein [Nanoarchaeota archaeon]
MEEPLKRYDMPSPELKRRKGLLKDFINKEELEDLLSQIHNTEHRGVLEKGIRGFMEKEEELINQDHKGKYALYYEGKLYGIDKDEDKLIKSFEDSEFGDYSFYCNRIGGD